MKHLNEYIIEHQLNDANEEQINEWLIADLLRGIGNLIGDGIRGLGSLFKDGVLKRWDTHCDIVRGAARWVGDAANNVARTIHDDAGNIVRATGAVTAEIVGNAKDLSGDEQKDIMKKFGRASDITAKDHDEKQKDYIDTINKSKLSDNEQAALIALSWYSHMKIAESAFNDAKNDPDAQAKYNSAKKIYDDHYNALSDEGKKLVYALIKSTSASLKNK